MINALTAITVAVSSLASFAAASPMPQPQPSQNPCSPNFQGVFTYIQAYNTYNRMWVPAGSQQTTIISTLSGGQTKWKIEGNGSAANDYTIKYVTPANQLLAGPTAGSTLALRLAQGYGNPTFDITCNSCYPAGNIPSQGTFIGNTCYISEHGTGRYLTETPQANGSGSLSLVPRNGLTNQFFHIVAA